MRLSHRISNEHGRDAAKFVERTLRGWALPVPKSSEYSITNDDGFLVALNNFGCTIRIQKETVARKRPEHDLLLKPLLSTSNGKMRIEVFPGVFCATSTQVKEQIHDDAYDSYWKVPQKIIAHMYRLKKTLSRGGFSFWDDAPRNFGFMPDKEGKPDWKKPIVLDLDAVEQSGFSKVFRLPEKLMRHFQCAAGVETNQNEFYGELREKFAQAAAQPEMKDRKHSMLSVWKSCAEACEKGTLVAGWRDVNARNISTIAKRYEESMASSPLLRRIL